MKKILLFLSLLIVSKSADASLFWKIDNGIEAYKKGDFVFARDYLQSYQKNNPNDADAYFWLGKTYAELNDSKSARENFKKAYELTFRDKNIEKIDFNAEISANIEDYFDMAAMYFEAGNAKEAEFYADMMLKINPKSPSAFFIKAKVAQLRGNKEQAQEYLKNAIIYNNNLLKTNLAKTLDILELPETAKQMYLTFALEAYFSGDLNSSIKHFKKYLEQDKTNIDVLNMLTDAYLKSDNLDLAQNILDEALKINPNNIQTKLNQIKIAKIKKDNKLSDLILEAYKINPNNEQVLLEVANYYLEAGDFENSKKYFEILINVNDESQEAYFGYIYSLSELGEVEKAVASIRKMASINKNSSENSYLLARVCELNGEFEEAFDYLSDALSKDENPNYYLELAKVSYLLGKYKTSLTNLSEAQKSPYPAINSDEIDEYFVKNYLKLADSTNASKYMDEKKLLDKNRLIYKYNLYILYKLQGDEKKALAQYTQALKAKPTSISDYLDLSEINYEQTGLNSAMKTLERGLKKFPKNPALEFQKTKLQHLSKKQETKNIQDEAKK